MKTTVNLAVLAVAAMSIFALPAMAQQNNNKNAPARPAPVHTAAHGTAPGAAPAAAPAHERRNAQTSQTPGTYGTHRTTTTTKQTANNCASQKTPAAVRACNAGKVYAPTAGYAAPVAGYATTDYIPDTAGYAPADAGAAVPASAGIPVPNFARRGVPMTNAQRGWSDDKPQEGDSANGDTAYGEGHGGGQ